MALAPLLVYDAFDFIIRHAGQLAIGKDAEPGADFRKRIV